MTITIICTFCLFLRFPTCKAILPLIILSKSVLTFCGLLPFLPVEVFWFRVIGLLVPVEVDATGFSGTGRGLLHKGTYGRDGNSSDSESELIFGCLLPFLPVEVFWFPVIGLLLPLEEDATGFEGTGRGLLDKETYCGLGM